MTIKLGFVSDSHNQPATSWGIQKCDIIIHSGDFSFRGTPAEINQFFVDAKKAMELSDARHFILCVGNHELGVQNNEPLFRQMCKDNGITLLIHEAVKIEGVKFFGTPWQPEFCNWAYNVWESDDLQELYDQIPDDTQVLITHCPPKGVLDYSPMCGHVGSPELLARVKQLKNLKFHSFGHIHYSSGTIEIDGVRFINAAILSDYYNLHPKEKTMQYYQL